jgi:hypothetical protein
MALTIGIVRALWRRKERDYAVICGVFLGVSLYGFLYDAGHLDVFACFNGVAAYWALRARAPEGARRPTASVVEAAPFRA